MEDQALWHQKSPMDKTTSDEQIKKQTPTPAGTRWKKYILYVPIRRRSKRCKKQASSSSQGSKAETSSGSPPSHSTKRKKDMMDESSSRQSASGTVEHCEGEEDEMDSLEITNVRMRACAYKALFQKQEKKVKVSGGCLSFTILWSPSQKLNTVSSSTW